MKRGITLILLLITLSFSVLALEDVTLKFTSPQQEDFSNYFLTLKYEDKIENKLLKSSDYSFKLEPRRYEIEAILNSFSTPAPDYYGRSGFQVAENTEVDFLLFPIGHLQGSVLDKNGNLVPKANLKFDCFSSSYVKYPEETDAAGFFTIPNIPVGKCTIQASTSQVASSTEIFIEQGKVTNIEIILEKDIASNRISTFLLILLLIAVITAGLYITTKQRNKRKKELEKHMRQHRKEARKEIIKDIKEQKKQEEKQEKSLKKQTEAIFTTLNPKEKKIVKFLLENDYSASQAKVRHSTGIPRTSLSRSLIGLERKKIIEIEKQGKFVLIKLTSFFLGQE